jgi:hypothetical protein
MVILRIDIYGCVKQELVISLHKSPSMSEINPVGLPWDGISHCKTSENQIYKFEERICRYASVLTS